MFIKSFFQCKRKVIAVLLFLMAFNVFSQEVPSIIQLIRFPLWAELDSMPSMEEYDESAGIYDFAINGVKKTAPFILAGMVYGWDFVYTPYDKERGVDEYFEIIPKENCEIPQSLINYSSPWIEDNKLNCWCEYTRSASDIQNYYLWYSIKNPRIKGIGYGALEKGFDGIQEAFSEAAKNAVREYYRGIIKNKPKEITGSVLIRKLPMLGVDAGRYAANLDFFLESGNIVSYTQY